MAEIWDAYDKQFNKIENAKLTRGETISADMYHLVGEIIVKHKDGFYLIMQRDLKKSCGGMWELTAGGSALQGENPLQCAIRELREETGIVSCELKEIERIVHDGYHTLFVEYLCITGWDKNSIVLQEGETINYMWVDKKTLLNMGPDVLASARAIKIVKELDL